jgi:predicted Zn-dependent protease
MALFIILASTEAARRVLPTVGRELNYRSACRQIESGSLEAAEAWLDGLISENPRDTRARLALAGLYRREGRITEAEETLQRAVELGLPVQAARTEHDLLRAGGLTTPATAEQPPPRVNR